jgi:hypothetical protein
MFSEAELETLDCDTLRHWLEGKLGGYKIAVKPMLAYNPLLRGNTQLYRGVRCEPRPNTISRISYPRPEHVTTLQRVNRIGQPRFYCSCSSVGMFYELHAKQGDLIAWSRWEVKEPLWMYNLGYHPEALRLLGTQEHNISMRQKITEAIPNETSENDKIRYEVSKAFTIDVPADKEYLYRLSIAINESFAKTEFEFPNDLGAPNHKNVAGTVYPSM